MPIRSKRIRNAAENEDCTLEIQGVCRNQTDTVVACHLPPKGETGMSRKGDDHFVAFGCARCHAVMDGKEGHMVRFGEDWLFYAFRGVYRTQQILAEKGILYIK